MAKGNRAGRFIWIHLLFFCSGFPALIYQIVWQRALFAIYGLNTESVTIVVSGFMLGLGLGGLVGGRLSSNRRLAPVKLFAIAELFTGIFGVVSLRVFHRIADFTSGMPPWETRAIGFFVIVLSTLLMGATLPPRRTLSAFVAECRVLRWGTLLRKLSGIWLRLLCGGMVVDAGTRAVRFGSVCCDGKCIGSGRRSDPRSSSSAIEE